MPVKFTGRLLSTNENVKTGKIQGRISRLSTNEHEKPQKPSEKDQFISVFQIFEQCPALPQVRTLRTLRMRRIDRRRRSRRSERDVNIGIFEHEKRRWPPELRIMERSHRPEGRRGAGKAAAGERNLGAGGGGTAAKVAGVKPINITSFSWARPVQFRAQPVPQLGPH